MITSKLGSKAQTTVPQAVRAALRLQEGDAIVYTIESDGRVFLSRAVMDHPLVDPFAIFSEWDSEADRRAYAEL
jgi:antitoxin PrlF